MSSNEIIAIILAGGQGSRLSKLTKNLAKPAVPFGGRYRIIDFALSNCYNSGIEIIGILTQYQPFELHSHIGASGRDAKDEKSGTFILPPYMKNTGGEWYKGTANAVYQNIEFIQRYKPQYVLVLSGDHVYKMDYRQIIKYHKQKNADTTIAVTTVSWEDASRFGVMNTDDNNRIAAFAEKPEQPTSNLVSMGVYVFNWPELHEHLLKDEQNPQSVHDFGKNVIPAMLQAGCALYAYPFQGYWMDVGTVESLWQANMDLLGDNSPFELFDETWPIYTVDPMKPPHLISGQACARQSIVSEGCQVYGKVERSVIFPGVYIAPGAYINNSVIMPNVNIGPQARIHNSIIGSGAVIAENCEIGQKDCEDITVIGESTCIDEAVKVALGSEDIDK